MRFRRFDARNLPVRRLARLGLASALLAFGCIDSRTPTESSSTGVILSGLVVDEAGSPRGGATVSCQGVKVATREMGAVGTFAIGGLRPGPTTVSLWQAGMKEPANVEVELFPGTNDRRLTLARYHGAPASASGVVTKDGAPLAGVRVTIASATAETGPDGSYRLSGLESGYWALTAAWGSYSEWDDAVALAPGANVVNVGIP